MKTRKLFSSALFAVLSGTGLIIMTFDEPVFALQWVGVGSQNTLTGACAPAGGTCSVAGATAACGHHIPGSVLGACLVFPQPSVCMY